MPIIHYITMVEGPQISKCVGIPYAERLNLRANQLPVVWRCHSTLRRDICRISPTPHHSLAPMLQPWSEWKIVEIFQIIVGREFGFHDPSPMYLLSIRDSGGFWWWHLLLNITRTVFTLPTASWLIDGWYDKSIISDSVTCFLSNLISC